MSTIRAAYPLSKLTRLEITQGDITQEPVDAIVNAANEHLAHGGGLAAAIVSAGGQSIQQESYEWVRLHGPVSHAEPAYTQAGRLPCRYIIHAVGPVWGSGSEDAKLASAITGSLRRAEELQLTSLAFPAISTGIFRFPVGRAARIFFETLKTYFIMNPASGISLVKITLWDDTTVKVFLEQARQALPAA
jgi:O-acetyl-ADP-ribose deacetylase